MRASNSDRNVGLGEGRDRVDNPRLPSRNQSRVQAATLA